MNIISICTITSDLDVSLITQIYLTIETIVMSSHELDSGMYFTRPCDLKEKGKIDTSDDVISQNRTKVESYSIKGSPPLSVENSIPDEYVLDEHFKDTKQKDVAFETARPRPTKPVIEDIYDDGHYCLARPPGISPHDNMRMEEANGQKDDDLTSSEKKRSPKRIIIGVVIGVVIIGTVGGIVAFFLPDSQGMIESSLLTI